MRPFDRNSATALPLRSGLGLKPEHYHAVLDGEPDVGFFEVHAENYMVDGGPFHHFLTQVREHYALSLHGVGLSIGGIDPLDEQLGARLERRAVHINANLTGLRVGPGVQLQPLDLLREPCYRRASGARFVLAWLNYKLFRVYIKSFSSG